jgi:DNA-binding NarL/FixJ family response regulator
VLHDRAVRAGARGIVHKEDPPEIVPRAIRKVHIGEFWLDRITVARLFGELLGTRSNVRPTAAQEQWSRLTARERQIIALVVANPSSSTRTLAAALHISEHTLRNHLTSIYAKLDVANRLELFVYAHEHGRHAGT